MTSQKPETSKTKDAPGKRDTSVLDHEAGHVDALHGKSSPADGKPAGKAKGQPKSG